MIHNILVLGAGSAGFLAPASATDRDRAPLKDIGIIGVGEGKHMPTSSVASAPGGCRREAV
jgi:hypothetical protein